MCVLWACIEERPSESVLRAGFDRNKDGAGIAWIENKKVRWMKGIDDVKDLVSEVEDLPLPFMAHCRLQSIGGPDLALTHPFPITPQVSTDLEGTSARVLAHNGHWTGWDDWMKRALFTASGKLKMPKGAWSDTRAIAWLAATYGQGMLELLPNTVGKVAVLDGPAGGFTHISGKWHLDDLKTLGYYQSSDCAPYRSCDTIYPTSSYTSLGTSKEFDFVIECERKINGEHRKFKKYVKYDKNHIRTEVIREILSPNTEIPVDAETYSVLAITTGSSDKLTDAPTTVSDTAITKEFTEEELKAFLEADDETIWAQSFGS